MKINLFIPAAGYGSRLAPLTDYTPKPLLPIAGVPAIERILMHAHSSLDIDRICINTHHLPTQIHSWVQSHPLQSRITLLHEEELLGTGGALWNGRTHLQGNPTMVLNADVLSGIDLAAFYKYHQASGNDVSLAVHRFDHARTVGIDGEGMFVCVGRQNDVGAQVTDWVGYACVAVYEDSFLSLLPAGNSHVVSTWLEARERGMRIGTWDIGSCYWRDIGSPSDYYTANYEYLQALARPFSLAEPLRIPPGTQLRGWGVIGTGVQFEKGVEIAESVIMDGAQLSAGSYANALVGVDFNLPVERTPSLCPHASPPVDIYPHDRFLKDITPVRLGSGGGDRRYYRYGKGLLACSPPGDTDVDFQRAHTDFFHRLGIRVPQIYAYDAVTNRLLLQDLGDDTLYSLCHKHPEKTSEYYKKVLDHLFALHSLDPTHCPLLNSRCLDKKTLLWESSYFAQRCIQGLFHQPIPPGLMDEFYALAQEVSRIPTGVIHRDCQSQNIMFYQDIPWFIDFQGARRGPALYDLASVLRDPYLDITPHRPELEEYYYAKLLAANHPAAHNFTRNLTLCGIQRHLQALGAYGFLSAIKGKKEYLTYVSPALHHLYEEVALVADEFPVLASLKVYGVS